MDRIFRGYYYRYAICQNSPKTNVALRHITIIMTYGHNNNNNNLFV